MSIDEYVNTPDALFHYTKTSTAIEHILYTKKFRLSLLKDTNDPKEYKFKIFSIFSDGLGYDILNNLSKEANPIIDRILRYESRVLCFCSNKTPTLILNDDNSVEDEHTCSKGWNKSRMWTQYSQNHYGVCLVFSHEALKEAIVAYKPIVAASMADFVKYSQRDRISWEATTLDGNRLEKEGVEKYSYNFIIENYKELLFQKHIDYRDEAEFRVVVLDPNKKLEYLDISSIIKCVIVGDRTPEVYFSLINEMCSKLRIESRRVYWHRGKLELCLCKST